MYKFLMSFLRVTSAQEVEKLKKENDFLTKDREALVECIKELKEQNELLRDENESLWDMLDEFNESAKLPGQSAKALMEEISDEILDEMMRNFKPAGEA
jgi:TATA-binding protein-associated factor Taf7